MIRLLAGIVIGAATTVALSNNKTKKILNVGKKQIKKGFDDGVESLKQTKEKVRQKIHDATAPSKEGNEVTVADKSKKK